MGGYVLPPERACPRRADPRIAAPRGARIRGRRLPPPARPDPGGARAGGEPADLCLRGAGSVLRPGDRDVGGHHRHGVARLVQGRHGRGVHRRGVPGDLGQPVPAAHRHLFGLPGDPGCGRPAGVRSADRSPVGDGDGWRSGRDPRPGPGAPEPAHRRVDRGVLRPGDDHGDLRSAGGDLPRPVGSGPCVPRALATAQRAPGQGGSGGPPSGRGRRARPRQRSSSG